MSSSEHAARHWCFTVNNYKERGIPDKVKAECAYVVAGYETAPGTGTPHVQGFLSTTKKLRRKQLSALFAGTIWQNAHLEQAKGTPLQASDYCKKGEDFEEHGALPVQRGQATLDRWASALQAARSGDLQAVDPQIQISHFRNLQAIALDSLPKQPDDLGCVAGLWIWGDTGTGKTTAARRLAAEHAPPESTLPSSLYVKEHSKWWDGYRGEETVLLDDLVPGRKETLEIFPLLLHWSDRWAFRGEFKGVAGKNLRPKRFVVTSNYPPSSFVQGPTLQAVLRRFFVARAAWNQSGEVRHVSWTFSATTTGHWGWTIPPTWWYQLSDPVLPATSSSPVESVGALTRSSSWREPGGPSTPTRTVAPALAGTAISESCPNEFDWGAWGFREGEWC